MRFLLREFQTPLKAETQTNDLKPELSDKNFQEQKAVKILLISSFFFVICKAVFAQALLTLNILLSV